MSEYTILQDTREQQPWQFDAAIAQTKIATLKSGDYTIEGLEGKFAIERKGTSAEFSQNIIDPRFEKELDRLDKLDHSFLVLEFTINDIYSFPLNSGIPSRFWGKLRLTPQYILKRLIEIETSHKVKIIFAGDKGSDYAERIFKEMIRRYANK